MTRNLFGGFPDEAITHGFSRRRPVRSVQIPPESRLRFHKKIRKNLLNLWDEIIPTKKNLCISVKSVGQNPPTKKNLRHLRNLRDKK